MKKAIVIVLDGVGCGSAPDSAAYGDLGADTLRHVIQTKRPALPNLYALGLGCLLEGGGYNKISPIGAYGRLTEQSAGKDTTSGHWEMAGLILHVPFPTFPNGFPNEILKPFEAAIGRGTLGNYASSGTEILDKLGQEHIQTGKPIVYTSADSVFQIAAHEDIIPPQALWAICEKARALLAGPNAVGRVIARPFIGTKGNFKRTGNRRDFSVPPPADTLLDVLSGEGFDVVGIGKIEDIFAHRGLTASDHAAGNPACLESTLQHMDQPINGLLFVNLVDFDALYGHRNDVDGFAKALEAVDRAIPSIMAKMGDEDLLIFTADHGCDPTYPGTDHTREYAPLLCWAKNIRQKNLGIRKCFGDISATILEMFGVKAELDGTSFYGELWR